MLPRRKHTSITSLTIYIRKAEEQYRTDWLFLSTKYLYASIERLANLSTHHKCWRALVTIFLQIVFDEISYTSCQIAIIAAENDTSSCCRDLVKSHTTQFRKIVTCWLLFVSDMNAEDWYDIYSNEHIRYDAC